MRLLRYAAGYGTARTLAETCPTSRRNVADRARSIRRTWSCLRKLTDDIDRLLEQQDAADSEDAESVTGGLKDLLLKFEADHPELSISLGKVADALAAIGI